MIKGIQEHFCADDVTLKETKYNEEYKRLVFRFYEEETENIYRVVLYLKDNENAKYIECLMLRIEDMYYIDELYAKGYMKFKSLLDTFRDCWFFNEELEEIVL